MAETMWDVPGVAAAWCAARVNGTGSIGHDADEPVTPASVMKIQVALAAAWAMDDGRLGGNERVTLDAGGRTPGPVGMSLFEDRVDVSARDLLVPMMTISDNVATDALIERVGLDAVNELTCRSGLTVTRVTSDIRSMLDGMAREAGFQDYTHLSRHDPHTDGGPSATDLEGLLAGSAALDPRRGTRTTAAEVVRLLSLIWTDAIASPAACARVRRLMARQLTRHRIASGFPRATPVAAKSGGLMGVVYNEAAVVTDHDTAYAVAIFTRRAPGNRTDASQIDASIGQLARRLVDALRPY